MRLTISSLVITFFGFGILLSSCVEDDACVEVTWYQDVDGDGLGNPEDTFVACEAPAGYVSNSNDLDDDDATNTLIIDVDETLFQSDGNNLTITTVDCTLSDGTVTKCFQVVSNSVPVDHDMGPWCPSNISDDASEGGIWLEGGEVYDVDGAFIENMANFYGDATWKMYDDEGNVYITETQQDCIDAANPNVGDEYQNFCVECLPSYITDIAVSFLIPITPVFQNTPAQYQMGGPPGMNTIPSTRGVALNGVEFSAPAPVNNILGAYTLAPFDDAGGHINVNQGYHYHAATGVSYAVEQSDGHPPLIGYALDGYGIYARTDIDGNEPSDLDECRGHTDSVRGYHYHVDAAGNNNFINCLHGAYAN